MRSLVLGHMQVMITLGAKCLIVILLVTTESPQTFKTLPLKRCVCAHDGSYLAEDRSFFVFTTRALRWTRRHHSNCCGVCHSHTCCNGCLWSAETQYKKKRSEKKQQFGVSFFHNSFDCLLKGNS
jgi:hypothetical protein